MKTTTAATTTAAPARTSLKIRTAVRAGTITEDISASAIGALVVSAPRSGLR